MKILIVSKLINPNNNIGAVRVYNFATELAKKGHTVFCVASENDQINCNINSSLFKICYAPIGKIEKKRMNYVSNVSISSKNNCKSELYRKKNKNTPVIGWLRKTVAQMWGRFIENEWYRNAVKICMSIISQEEISLVLTSYGPLANLLVGLKLKKDIPQLIWISDMRDPVDSMHQQFLWRVRGAYLQRKMLRYSDRVITVCDGVTNRYKAMLTDNMKKKVYTITNGYKEEPILYTPNEDGILKIGYTGQLYNGIRDMSELFRCVDYIQREKGKSLPIQIHYAGNDSNKLIEQARQYGVEKYIVDHGRVSKFDALRLQEKCDILCVLTWNTKKEQGVLTGKFPEYLRLCKPILAIITGDLENAELSKRIEELNIGFSYECMKSESDFIKFKIWLENCINNKCLNQPIIDATINRKGIGSYSYKALSQKLEKILMSI